MQNARLGTSSMAPSRSIFVTIRDAERQHTGGTRRPMAHVEAVRWLEFVNRTEVPKVGLERLESLYHAARRAQRNQAFFKLPHRPRLFVQWQVLVRLSGGCPVTFLVPDRSLVGGAHIGTPASLGSATVSRSSLEFRANECRAGGIGPARLAWE
jgi:hypothetical protein